MKYFCTRSPYDEWRSGAATSSKHDKGNPPPRISSREVMPVDVIQVEGDAGEIRVPGSAVACFNAPLRLKEDMS